MIAFIIPVANFRWVATSETPFTMCARATVDFPETNFPRADFARRLVTSVACATSAHHSLKSRCLLMAHVRLGPVGARNS